MNVSVDPRLAAPVASGTATETAYAQFLAVLTEGDASRLVENIRTTIAIRRIGEHAIPLSVNDAEYDNSFVCSPYSTLVVYALEELAGVGNRWLRWALSALVRGGGVVLRLTRINAAVVINNWLVSTSPHLHWRGEAAVSVLETIAKAYPGHYILVRSIDDFHHAAFKQALGLAGCDLIPVRQVYYLDLHGDRWLKRRNTQRDLAYLAATDLATLGHDDFRARDFDRLAWLYGKLYIEKHSRQNPRFTPAFIQACHATGVLRFIGLRDRSGEVVAFAALHMGDDVASAVFIGYDAALPQDLGHYRLIMALMFEEAKRSVRYLNCGAGAGAFKRSRGAVPHAEYMAVYARHLPLWRRLPCRLAAYLMREIGTSVMLDYGL